MGYRDTGGGPKYVPETDISLGVLRYQAEQHLGDADTYDEARVAWEQVSNLLAIIHEGKRLVNLSIDAERITPRLAAWAVVEKYE